MREGDFAQDGDRDSEEDISFGVFAFAGFEVTGREGGPLRVFGGAELFSRLARVGVFFSATGLFCGGLCGRGALLQDGWLEVLVAEVPEEEGEDVGPVGDLLVDGVGDPVAGVVIDAEEDGASAGGVSLKASGHLGSLPGIDAGIVCAGGDEDGGIFCVGLDVVVGAHGIKRLESIFGFHCAEFGNVGRTVGAGFRANHVRARNSIDGCCEEVGALGDGAADEDSAGALAPDSQVQS